MAAAEPDPPKCVTWPQFISAMTAVLTLLGVGTGLMWSEHAKHPHQGAVTRQEHAQFTNHVERTLERAARDDERLEQKIDRLDGRFDALLRELRKK